MKLHPSKHFKADSSEPDPNSFGQKAAGLFAFPVFWTPPFVLIDSTAHEMWASWSVHEREAWSLAAARAINDALAPIASQYVRDADGILIRSSSVDEGLNQRGQLESKHFSSLTGTGLFAFLTDLFSADPHKVGKIAIIGQVSVPADRRIHLSNERRCSKTKNEWLVTQALSDNVFVPAEGCNSINARYLDESSELRLTPGTLDRDLRSILRAVGKWANKRFQERVHFEIVVSGSRVFLVQVDSEEDRGGVDPCELALDFRSGDPSVTNTLTRFQLSSPTKFKKLANIADFETTTYKPPHRLFFATAKHLAAAIARDSGHSLREEIEALTGGRLVIREDVSGGSGPGFNLHRTDTINSHQAIQTLRERIAYWEDQPHAADDICFIIHGFLPARASAWAMYSRAERRIRIHALWGLPDGLQFLTPDEYEWDLATGGWSERTHFKEFFLRERDDGTWGIERVSLDVARTKVLSRAQASAIGELTQDIAAKLDSDVHIMFFCGIPKEAGVGDVLPWYRAREAATYESKREKRLQRVEVRKILDLERVDLSRPIALSLMPDIENYRDNEFIRAVAQFAVKHQVPVEIQGSPLAHAYYILQQAGCTVFLAHAPAYERVRNKREFGKLVRDKIVSRIGGGGEKSVSFILKPEDRPPAFFGKLLEEGIEVLRADSTDSRISEFADLFEVVRSWIESANFELSEVEAIANLKRQKTGAFAAAEVLVETGSKSSPIGTHKASSLSLDRITMPREASGTLAVPAGRLGLLANGESLTVSIPDTGIGMTLSMNDEGDLIVGIDRDIEERQSDQLSLFP
jgi:predicted house-cleaning noncanonical NTP pyrophosphatase (MazG superfamily)